MPGRLPGFPATRASIAPSLPSALAFPLPYEGYGPEIERGPWLRSSGGGNSEPFRGLPLRSRPRRPAASRVRIARTLATCAGGYRRRAGRRVTRYRGADRAGSFRTPEPVARAVRATRLP